MHQWLIHALKAKPWLRYLQLIYYSIDWNVKLKASMCRVWLFELIIHPFINLFSFIKYIIHHRFSFIKFNIDFKSNLFFFSVLILNLMTQLGIWQNPIRATIIFGKVSVQRPTPEEKLGDKSHETHGKNLPKCQRWHQTTH